MTLNYIDWAQILGHVFIKDTNPDGHVTLIITTLFKDVTEEEKMQDSLLVYSLQELKLFRR
jgi:hypothetical protein